jgi:hypothetical protein
MTGSTGYSPSSGERKRADSMVGKHREGNAETSRANISGTVLSNAVEGAKKGVDEANGAINNNGMHIHKFVITIHIDYPFKIKILRTTYTT